MDEYGTVPKCAATAQPGILVNTQPCLGGIKHDVQASVPVFLKSEAMQKTTLEKSPLFDPDIVSRIKLEKDSDSIETDDWDPSVDREHTNYVSRRPVSEDRLERFAKSCEIDQFHMVPEFTDTLKTGLLAQGESCSKEMKHEDQMEIDEVHESEIRMRTVEVCSLVFDQNTFFNTKKEDETEATESADSDVPERGKLGRRETGLLPTIQLDIKVQETCLGHFHSSDNDVTSTYRKSETEEVKQQQMYSNESASQSAYKCKTCEKQTIYPGAEENVGEYRLEKISLYETGFCVIMDPFILQGAHPAPIPYPITKPKKERKRYDCSECGKSLSDSTRLQVHQRIHTGERPFQCPTCEKRFMDRHRLVNHIMIHTGERPYKCKKCDKSFNQRPSLNKHQRTHERKRD